MRERTAKFIQYLSLVAGVILLAAYALATIHSWVSSRKALRVFDQAQAAGSAGSAESGSEESRTKQSQDDEEVDFSLWSEKRLREYRESLSIEMRLPLAVLSIDRLHIRVPVFEGTDDLVLNRGVGWIADTTKPGETGNIGIAGHRDGFFGGLKDIVVGDTVELMMLKEQFTYVVDQIEIVYPESVEVLRPRAFPSLTLVTCYPFYSLETPRGVSSFTQP